ncbi:hypothetical protein TVAG_027690 [Trichomonas vaginalis G3]|uniref:Uncharacterized protein n=1 Tax=Trichomonas vaginalis (strain ATCC PRA-98 / G3) TaxID=412133 RepID=A2E508_TRIV3|nr:hypothetical protein TVAGG3_0420390 [Trichomonas vaginalis G3]EAY12216.1 hypothetical protein TVAG_027690 [Trichomonas vaginalis G3]KAI5536002.1 hypothetical protein TVAGG3_0420390 [Trichomonas vaginalis G3]|eukprot:XP_001324439.1 hypothetical protein [Trichomonas vaginalis G3]
MSGFLSLRDLGVNDVNERPKPPSVKLAERWNERDKKPTTMVFTQQTIDSEQDALNKKIAEKQADIQFLMQKSTYYSRNSINFANEEINSQKSSIISLNSSPSKSSARNPPSPLRSPSNSTFNTRSTNPSGF